MNTTLLSFKWTVSRARDTYGYNVCTLFVDGRKAARCNGGGYDMEATCLGDYIASQYAERLCALGHEFYGLTFHDPDYESPEGDIIGLARYQAFYRASSKVASERHTVPLIDGACGWSAVEHIIKAIGLVLEEKDKKTYLLTERGQDG